MLGLHRGDLATAAAVAPSTLYDFELGRRQPHPRTLQAIRAALEALGILFIPADDESGPGVRLARAILPDAVVPHE